MDFANLGKEFQKVLKPKKRVRNKSYIKMLRRIKRGGF